MWKSTPRAAGFLRSSFYVAVTGTEAGRVLLKRLPNSWKRVLTVPLRKVFWNKGRKTAYGGLTSAKLLGRVYSQLTGFGKRGIQGKGRFSRFFGFFPIAAIQINPAKVEMQIGV